jgi:PTS system nitrogen regulatory IIA component
MDLTVRDVAKLLKVPEKTVYRWIEKEQLPAYRLHEQYRLNRVELQEWAAEHEVKLPAELYADRESDPPGLAAALERGGIHRNVPGVTRDQVLRAVVDLPGIPATVDRDLLYELLVTREALSSTGLGSGIAVPHPRTPLVLQLSEPVVMVCFLANPVDFGAVDRQPVRVLILLLSTTVQSHLRMLSRIAHALHDAELRRHVDAAAADEVIVRRVRAIETEISRPPRTGSRR